MRLSQTIRWRLRIREAIRERLGVPRVTRHSLAWDMAAGVCAGVFMGMTMPFLTKIARGELQSSQNAIALMVAAPFIGNLFSPFWARQMEGREKIPFCLYSWSAARGLLLLMPLASTGPLFVLLITLMQIIGTVASPAYTSIMRDIYPDSARGRLMGYVRVCLQAAMFLATLITGRLLDSGVSYRMMFPVAGLFGIGAALAFRHVRALPRSESPSSPVVPADSGRFLFATIRILRENRPYRYFALSVFVYGFANLMVQPLYGLYQVDVLHISSTQIANLTNVASLCAIAGAFFWGRFMDRHGPPTTVMCSITLIALIPILYLTVHRVEGLFLAAILSGLGFAGIELSYLSSILLYADRERTAQYQSLHSLLLGIRGVIAPLLGIPLITAFGYPPVFLGALVFMLIGAALQWFAVRAGSRSASA
ncbi:MAG: MFS transporter [Capsulimonadales bacterium]|nr:MFS transporter [Capsulimonadales bacterium]